MRRHAHMLDGWIWFRGRCETSLGDLIALTRRNAPSRAVNPYGKVKKLTIAHILYSQPIQMTKQAAPSPLNAAQANAPCCTIITLLHPSPHCFRRESHMHGLSVGSKAGSHQFCSRPRADKKICVTLGHAQAAAQVQGRGPDRARTRFLPELLECQLEGSHIV